MQEEVFCFLPALFLSSFPPAVIMDIDGDTAESGRFFFLFQSHDHVTQCVHSVIVEF